MSRNLKFASKSADFERIAGVSSAILTLKILRRAPRSFAPVRPNHELKANRQIEMLLAGKHLKDGTPAPMSRHWLALFSNFGAAPVFCLH